ncbi:hypothetical protein FHG87_015181 [Trinorchestia longiramus]|nr:hypothetical protein FHG87_015181 [Trinorchestia longiramus]
MDNVLSSSYTCSLCDCWGSTIGINERPTVSNVIQSAVCLDTEFYKISSSSLTTTQFTTKNPRVFLKIVQNPKVTSSYSKIHCQLRVENLRNHQRK